MKKAAGVVPIRLGSLLFASVVFEGQILLFEMLAKPQNAALQGNPLDVISGLGFMLAWITGANSEIALLLATLSLLPIPLMAYRLCGLGLQYLRRVGRAK